MAAVDFIKYSGCGNDFIVVDNREGGFPYDGEYIRRLCRRRVGIGADGVILLENTTDADYKMRIFNADGSEAEMCGNGIRCLYRFLYDFGEGRTPRTIATMAGIHQLCWQGELISVSMPPPSCEWNIEVDGIRGDLINTGVPHLVIQNPTFDFENLAPALRRHKRFGDAGANINLLDTSTLTLRTYERGIEAETLACGTGATAAALAYTHATGKPGPHAIKVASGDELHITTDEGFLSCAGPASPIYQGSVAMPAYSSPL